MTSDQKEIKRLKERNAGLQESVFSLEGKLIIKELRIKDLQDEILELMKEIKP